MLTRSSWHHWWRLLTFFSLAMCVVFGLVALGNSQPPGVEALQGMPAAVQAAYYDLAEKLAELLAMFWGLVAMWSCMAWAACAMALRERKEFEVRSCGILLGDKREVVRKEFDASLRD